MNTQTPPAVYVPPSVPVGLATKLGVLTAALASIFAGVADIADGDHQPETVAGLLAAALTVYGVVRGRSDQSAALLAGAGASLPLMPVTNVYGVAGTVSNVELDDEPAIPDSELEGREGCAPLGHGGVDLSGGEA
jgi:hypothetical protein